MLCYFGHQKCASTWVKSLVYEVCLITGYKTFEKQINLATEDDYDLINKTEFYISQNSDYSKLSKLKDFKAFHVIRDPRDLIVSAYYSHMKTHSTVGWNALLMHRKILEKLNKRDGLLKEIEFSGYFLNHINEWYYNNPNILELKMEDFTSNPECTLKNILIFFDLYSEKKINPIYICFAKYINRITRKFNLKYKIPVKLDDITIKKIAYKYRFQKLAKGRVKGEENINSHYRKGISGDWKNHFEDIHIKTFNDKYPKLIDKLNYNN